jgi:hypothetical protein
MKQTDAVQQQQQQQHKNANGEATTVMIGLLVLLKTSRALLVSS